MRPPTLDSHESAIVDRVLLADTFNHKLNRKQRIVVSGYFVYGLTEPELAVWLTLLSGGIKHERHQIQTIKNTALRKLRRELVAA